MSDYTIVIPAWNESELIANTLQAVDKAMQHQRFAGDVIVVDNNSTDNTADIARRHGATVVFEPINQIARARNTGAHASSTKWLIFLDADSVISHELVGASLNALACGNVIGGGSVVAMDRELKGIAKFTLNFWNWWSRITSTAAGCYIYCTKEAFDSIGGFDQKRYAAEELYFSKNLRKLAKTRNQEFVIQTLSPIVSSARKLDWYSPKQMLCQVLLLLVPGSTLSRSKMPVWYDRENIRKP